MLDAPTIERYVEDIKNTTDDVKKVSKAKKVLDAIKARIDALKKNIGDFTKVFASLQTMENAATTFSIDGIENVGEIKETTNKPLSTGNRAVDREIANKWTKLTSLRDLIEQYKLFLDVLQENVDHEVAQATLEKATKDYDQIVLEYKKLNSDLQKIAKNVLPSSLRTISKLVVDQLRKDLKGRYDEKRLRYEVMVGLDAGNNLLIGLYLIFFNLVDDEGMEYDRYQVVLTKSGNGIHVNVFSGSKIKTPGTYALGPTVTGSEDALHIIYNRLAADSFLSVVHPRPIPFKSDDFKRLSQVGLNDYVKYIEVKDNIIVMPLENTVTSENINEVKDLIRGKLTTFVRTKSNTRDLMKMRVYKTDGFYVVEVKFVVPDDFKGQHVSPYNYQKLSELLGDADMRKLRDFLEK